MFEYSAIIASVYDGDTVTADVDLGFGFWFKGQKLRLLGIDAPEMRGETLVPGRAARDYLRDLILGKYVVIRTVKDGREKYGRYLATIFLPEERESVNDKMLNSGHANPYD